MPASCASNLGRAAIAGPCRAPEAGVLAPLIAAIRRAHGDAVCAVIYYGSCLRSGDPRNGLIDCYVIVDGYRAAHKRRISALFNYLIPPNVYYLEAATTTGPLRCKYAVLSRGQLAAGVSRWFQSSIWGRFAQPVAIVYARDEAIRDEMRARCGEAVVSLLERALPALPARLTPADGFARALRLSYDSELRVERDSRSAELVAADAREYQRRFRAALPWLSFPACETASGEVVFTIAATRRARARLAWALRPMLVGRALSVLRLAKACFTFANAIDYAAWKLERHTGVAVTVTPKLCRHPLIFGTCMLWRLYRQRVLR